VIVIVVLAVGVVGIGSAFAYLSRSLALNEELQRGWQIAHDGFRDEDYPEAYLYAADWEEALLGLDGVEVRGLPGVVAGIHHDQLDLQSTFNAGLGLSFAATPSLDLSVVAARTITGRGGHATNLALSVGATWSFSPARLFRKKDEAQAAARPGVP